MRKPQAVRIHRLGSKLGGMNGRDFHECLASSLMLAVNTSSLGRFTLEINGVVFVASGGGTHVAEQIRPEKIEALRKRLESLGILESDLKEKFVRGSGSGGQKINKTASAVQITHVPSGIEVKSQRARSQAANRFFARRELADRYEEQVLGKQTKRNKKAEKARKQKQRRKRRGRSGGSDNQGSA